MRASARVSTMCPACITAMWSQRAARPAPRSWVIKIVAMPMSLAQFADQVHDDRLRGDVEAGGRLVGDQQLRAGGERDARSSRAGTCRRTSRTDRPWRAAPDRDADRAQHLDRASRARRRGVASACADSTSAICRPTGRIGLSAARGFWKIIAISRPRIRQLVVAGAASRSMLAQHGAAAGRFVRPRSRMPMIA